jgi:hypothetical protein
VSGLHLLLLALPVTQAAAGVPVPAVVLDGRFDDWKGVRVAVRDTVDAPGGDVDVREVRVTHDAEALYVLLDLERPANLHTLRGTLSLAFDADGDVSTGRDDEGLPGADLVVELSPPGTAGPTAGARLLVPGTEGWAPHDLYEAGLLFAPSYASRRVELALRRGARIGGGPPLFRGARVRGRVSFRDPGGVLADETRAFAHVWDPARAPARVSMSWATDPLARPGPDALRVVSWNVARDDFIDDHAPFARVLGALRPDVVILDEVPPQSSAEHVERFLSVAVPPAPLLATAAAESCAAEAPGCAGPAWRAVFGSCGGRQRVAVAATAELSPVGALRWVDYPEPPLRVMALEPGNPADVDALMAQGVGTGGALVRLDARRRLLAASVDLQCCGAAASLEERLRVIEVSAIRAALQQAVDAERPDAVILAGDFNLVGSRVPLDVVSRHLDPRGDHLEVVDALQLDGRSNATWSDPGKPFAPGRLDYMLYSDSTLEVARAFVFDSADLGAEWLDRHGVQAGDSAAASDHLPIVADFRWKRR